MEKYQYLIDQMTLEEKASLCSGSNFWYTKEIERLGIPSIMLTDGPHGLRKQSGDSDQLGLNESVPATCFPTASALAATWNRDLIYLVGQALGEECRQEKVGVILGPGANIKRSPLCGRNFEYFSEDPFLSGEIAKSHIKGVQSLGIGTSLKHYAANNQEFRRMTIDVIIDTRALREIYLAGFEIAVQGAQPWTVMGAYNQVNGTYCCENPLLLTQILKDEWGHEGLVVTDWGAMNERVAALAAGLELEMPGSNNGNDEEIAAAVKSGELDETILDNAVARILDLVFKAHTTLEQDFTYDPAAHHALAQRVASEGAVLLKNEESTLPIEKGSRVALIGAFAKSPRYQGAGSSIMNPSKLDTLYDQMLNIAGEGNLCYAPGYELRGLEKDDALITEAVECAQEADVVIVNVGLPDIFEVEGLDRTHLDLPESHNKLVEALASAHPRVVVVLSNGAPVLMPWIDDVQAVLEGYLGGQAGAGAIADILFGNINPSGKLAETFPLKLEDTPCYRYFPGGPKIVEYRESIYVGYRFYNSVDKAVLFPFGHGLSYTRFEYTDLQLSRTKLEDNDILEVQVTIKNTGKRAGKEVVQLYIGMQNPTAFRPTAELKGFEKIALEPGEEKTVTFLLEPRAFAFYNTDADDWQVESGTYRIMVGSSSRDIRLQDEVHIQSLGDDVLIPKQDQLPVYKHFPVDAQINQTDFETLIHRPIPLNTLSKRDLLTINTPIADMKHSLVGRQLHKMIAKQLQQIIGDDPNSPTAYMMQAVVDDAPMRTLLMMGDQMNRETIDGLLMMINRRYLKGILYILRNRNKKRRR